MIVFWIFVGDLGASANLDLLEDFLLSYSCVHVKNTTATATTTATSDHVHDIGSTVLRLLCLHSLTSGGIRAGKYDTMRKIIVQTFGYRYALTMWNLEKAGFLRRKDNLQSMLMGTAMTSMTGGESSMQSVAAMATMMGSIGQQTSSSATSSSIPSSVQHGSSSMSSSNSVNSSSSNTTGPGSSTYTNTNAMSVDWQVLRKQLRLLHSSSSPSGGDEGKDTASGGGSSGKRGMDEEKQQSSGGGGSGMYDISYAANGFTPLMARLVQLLYGTTTVLHDEKNKSTMSSSSSNAAIVEAHNALRLLPGPFVELNGMDQDCASFEDLHESITRSNSHVNTDSKAAMMIPTSISTSIAMTTKRKHKRKKTLVILVVGGISVLEMASLRCLSRDPTFPYRILMATTEVLHGNSIMRSFFAEE